MSKDMESTKYQNVYQRASSKRRNPRDGKMDICYYITYRKEGKKKWERIGWKSEGFTGQMACQVRADRMQEIRVAEVMPDSVAESQGQVRDFTMDQAWEIFTDKWLRYRARPKGNICQYKLHVSPRFGCVLLDRVTTLELEQFKNDLLDSGLAPATVHMILGNIRSLYNKMTEWELYTGRIPTAKLQMPKIDNKRVRFLTPPEVSKLMERLKSRSIMWWRMAMISLKTGMRIGEILSLTKNDINLENGIIHIMDGKTGSRVAHMSDSLKEILKDFIDESETIQLFPPQKQGANKFAYSTSTFPNAVKEAGLNTNITDRRQKVVFHTLRHTFASWLAMRGVPLYTISILMGHASLEMTKRYAHLCPDTQREAVQQIDFMESQGF